ncbi:MAG: BadF/BadG/BcrA/BcrD ATPase family protein [Pyrinomonadaceae bacterium]
MATSRAKSDRTRRSYPLYLGVDGGGTKTQIALIDESEAIVAEGTGGPSNPLRVGVETAVANISKAIDTACDSAGVSRGDIAAATLGLAGVRREDIRERVRESFDSRYRSQKTAVMTDADIALFGTTFGKPGLVVIAGTGSICLGMNAAGERAIAGGWGPIAGDEGGGRGIADQALHSVAKASDGRGPATKLSERAAEYFRASNVENLLVAIYAPQIDNSRIAGFARLVVETAREGDEVAVGIIHNAGRELGTAAVAVLKRLRLVNEKVPIGCVGSVFGAGNLLTRPMIDAIRASHANAYLTDPVMLPSMAAALMSLRMGTARVVRRPSK